MPATSICWDADASDRYLYWFAEVFDPGDSMGGWVGGVENHLDYTTMRYTVNTGWLSPNFSYPTSCPQQELPRYRCKRTGADRMFIQTNP